MSTPWWMDDREYYDEVGVPTVFDELAGPKGVALVRAWPDGRTDAGWGLQGKDARPGFMEKYLHGGFNERRVLFGYTRGKWAFAFIMRSVRMVCIDIDGKNGGLEHAKRLGMLPRTLAETSKSGDGYHLFYSVDEQWDPKTGFGLFSDRIGLEQGVDIRAVGCVYHHENQRWNGRAAAPLPKHLVEQLKIREQRLAASSVRIKKVLESEDEMEVLMLQDELVADLAKPIAQGKRNTTLFAIGQQMREAAVPEWSVKLRERCFQVGLGDEETNKLVANVERYAVQTP